MDASSAHFVDVSSYVQTRSQFRQMSAKGLKFVFVRMLKKC